MVKRFQISLKRGVFLLKMKFKLIKFKYFVCVSYRSIQILEDQVPSVVLQHAEAELKNRFADKYKN